MPDHTQDADSDARYNGETGSIRQRCAALGIRWLEEPPEASADAVALISPEVAVRLRVVPLRIAEDHLVAAMVEP